VCGLWNGEKEKKTTHYYGLILSQDTPFTPTYKNISKFLFLIWLKYEKCKCKQNLLLYNI